MRSMRLALALVGALSAPLFGGCHPNTCAPPPASPSASSVVGANAAARCTRDADCQAASTYCGGCNCVAIPAGAIAPDCDSPVQCFAEPCLGKEAACVGGTCVVRAACATPR